MLCLIFDTGNTTYKMTVFNTVNTRSTPNHFLSLFSYALPSVCPYISQSICSSQIRYDLISNVPNDSQDSLLIVENGTPGAEYYHKLPYYIENNLLN